MGKPSARALSDEKLGEQIRPVHEKSRKTYGPQRIKDDLSETGVHVGRDHIARLRKKMGLKCIQKRKFKATTNSSHDLPTVENLLGQKFSNLQPGEVWGTDITYIPADEGWLYLAGVKDFGSREVVGWATSERMTKDLVRKALQKALAYRKPLPGCIHHSDKGRRYARATIMLVEAGINAKTRS
jgi:putative transposase